MATTWFALALETAAGMTVAGAATAWLRARLIAERVEVLIADALGEE